MTYGQAFLELVVGSKFAHKLRRICTIVCKFQILGLIGFFGAGGGRTTTPSTVLWPACWQQKAITSCALWFSAFDGVSLCPLSARIIGVILLYLDLFSLYYCKFSVRGLHTTDVEAWWSDSGWRFFFFFLF